MNDTVYKIRNAVPEDAEQMFVLSSQLGYPAEKNDIQLRLELLSKNEKHLILVAEDSGTGIVGWIHVIPRLLLMDEPTAEIGGMVVDRNHRRKGVGRLMVQNAEIWAQKKGFTKIVVRSNELRESSHRFYPNIGYKLLKTQKTYTKSLP